MRFDQDFCIAGIVFCMSCRTLVARRGSSVANGAADTTFCSGSRAGSNRCTTCPMSASPVETASSMFGMVASVPPTATFHSTLCLDPAFSSSLFTPGRKVLTCSSVQAKAAG